jgi:site-specific recombinase XerD
MISSRKNQEKSEIPKSLYEKIIRKPWFDQVINYKEFLDKRRLLSSYTIRNYVIDLTTFFEFLNSISLKSLHDLHKNHIRGYMRWLSMRNVSRKSISRKLSSLKTFFTYLEDNNEISHNPAEMVKPPKQDQKLPRIENSEDISKMMEENFISTKMKLRNSTIIEVLYGSGMRVSELRNLLLENINLESGEIKVKGKGNKERIVLIGEKAVNSIKKYLDFERKTTSNTNYLFLNKFGNPISTRSIQRIVKKYSQIAGLHEDFHTHTLRHSFATHMLDGGADIKVVQELLGHSSPTTTQIYTHISKEKMKEIYNSSHPRSKNA